MNRMDPLDTAAWPFGVSRQPQPSLFITAARFWPNASMPVAFPIGTSEALPPFCLAQTTQYDEIENRPRTLKDELYKENIVLREEVVRIRRKIGGEAVRKPSRLPQLGRFGGRTRKFKISAQEFFRQLGAPNPVVN